MDRYTARMNLHGTNTRKRYTSQFKEDISRKSLSNPSYKDVKLNGVETHMIINSGTETFYKDFQSLPGQQIFAGDYVEWSNQIWLVYAADSDDEMYIDGKLRQCQHQIFWQKEDGTIISRYVWTQNASAYNNGEQGNNYITLQSNQFMVYMPYDDDTAILDNGIRIHMSRSNLKCKPYTLTRPDDIACGYGEKGVLNIIFTQAQYNPEKDKLITLEDGTSVWICDYHSPTPTPDELDYAASIQGNKNMGIGISKVYSVKFTDSTGTSIDPPRFEWNIISDFFIQQDVNDNTIELLVKDEDLLSSTFLLQVIVGRDVVAEEKIMITGGY